MWFVYDERTLLVSLADLKECNSRAAGVSSKASSIDHWGDKLIPLYATSEEFIWTEHLLKQPLGMGIYQKSLLIRYIRNTRFKSI